MARRGIPVTPYMVKAQETHKSKDPELLSFKKGALIAVFETTPGRQLLHGEYKGKHGWFPASMAKESPKDKVPEIKFLTELRKKEAEEKRREGLQRQQLGETKRKEEENRKKEEAKKIEVSATTKPIPPNSRSGSTTMSLSEFTRTRSKGISEVSSTFNLATHTQNTSSHLPVFYAL
jgi:hypothetical protein